MLASDRGFLLQMVNAGAKTSTVVVLTGGDDVISKPAEARAVLISPDGTTTADTYLLKGAAGDDGLIMSNRLPILVAFDDADTSFIMNGDANDTFNIEWFREG